LIRGSFWVLLTLVIVFGVVGKIAEVVSFQHGSTRTVIGTVAGALGVLTYLLLWRIRWRREADPNVQHWVPRRRFRTMGGVQIGDAGVGEFFPRGCFTGGDYRLDQERPDLG
jgi:hypothetical protein